MPISMECPSCLNRFSPPDEMAGRKAHCPACRCVLFIPRAETAVDAARPPQGAGVSKGTAAPNVKPIKKLQAAAPQPLKPAQGVAQKATAANPPVRARDNPFDFRGEESASPRRRRRGVFVLVLLLLFALGGLVLAGAGGGAAWYFWNRAAPTKVVEAVPEKAKEEVRQPEPKEGPQTEPPMPEPSSPKNPGGKPTRDPIIDPPNSPKKDSPPKKEAPPKKDDPPKKEDPPMPDAAPVEVKELAVLKGPAGPVQWLTMSDDGSRLVAASQGIVWDVDGQRQVCVCKNPAPGNGPTGFGSAWLSADGQTLLTNGGAFQVWDAKTGNEVFKVPALKFGGLRSGSLYTAVALSRDGAYLAVAVNEFSGKSRGTIYSYTGGKITIWDMKTGKVKWTVPGVDEEAEASIDRDPLLKGHVNQLAFSPDGGRLAALGEALRLFTLDADKDAPAAAGPKGHAGSGQLEWLSDDKALFLQEGRAITVLDPKNGNRKDNFTLNYPRLPRPKPVGNRLPLPEPAETEAPEGWNEYQITLSADGSRLAAHIIREHENAKMRNNAVVLWDVAARRRVGVYNLPDDAYNPGTMVIAQSFVPPILIGTGHDSALRIALSGDGSRLAVADAAGVVTVYSTAQIEAHTKQTEPKPPPPPPITDGFTVGSVWNRVKGPPPKLLLPALPQSMKITERDGPQFKAELTFDEKTVGEAAGTIGDGHITFATVEAIKGAPQPPQAGAIKGDAIEWTFTGPVFPKGRVTEIVKMSRAPDK